MPCHLCSGRRQRWPDPPLPRRVRHGQDHDGQRCCPACQQEGAAHQLPLAGVQRGWRGCTLHIQVGLGLFWHAIGPSCNYSISSAIRQAMVSPGGRCRILSHCAGDTWIKMASVWIIDLRSPATTCKVSQHPCRGCRIYVITAACRLQQRLPAGRKCLVAPACKVQAVICRHFHLACLWGIICTQSSALVVVL